MSEEEDQGEGDERLIPINEILEIYSNIGIRKKEFIFFDPNDILPEEPYIDLQQEMLLRIGHRYQ